MPTLTPRENYLAAHEFRHPQWIPVTVELECEVHPKKIPSF